MTRTTVADVELATPPTAEPETTVTEAAQFLRRPDVPAVPVLEDDAVVGIVTESDVVALVAETDDRPAVETIMSTPVTTVSPAATLAEAAGTMRSAGVRRLPVVVDDTYGGVLSARTLAPYLSRRRLDIEWQDAPTRVGSAESGELTAPD
ncbi:MAG: cyclic nucleotide-binding/CBS domain-containing protein [Haloferacaceae archaeon]